MQSTRVIRAAGVAGLVASVLILGGFYLVVMGLSGTPAIDGDPQAWAAWARREENAIEAGAYLLIVPGLLLFLVMFSALAALLPANGMSTRLAGYGALAFSIFFAASGVLSSTTASTFGFYKAFEDPTAAAVFTWSTAGYHLQAVGVWSLAMTIVASAVGLRQSKIIASPVYAASLVLAALAVAGSLIGFGVIPCLIWMIAVGIGLLRSTPSASTG